MGSYCPLTQSSALHGFLCDYFKDSRSDIKYKLSWLQCIWILSLLPMLPITGKHFLKGQLDGTLKLERVLCVPS